MSATHRQLPIAAAPSHEPTGTPRHGESIPCEHSRIHAGLDAAYCPDCKRSFSQRSKEYKNALRPRPPEHSHSRSVPVPQNTPTNSRACLQSGSGWIEKYLVKGRWEHHRYCWQAGRKGKVHRLHIPSNSGKLLQVKRAIALHYKPEEIVRLLRPRQ